MSSAISIEAWHRGVVAGAYLTSSLTLEYDDEHTFPFTEDENSNVTGFGHQDKQWFADAINKYYLLSGGLDSLDDLFVITADDVSHDWVRLDPKDDERLQPCAATTLGAIPVTTVWGVR